MQTTTDKKQEILDAYAFRHACKEFDASRKIPDDDFKFILETARLSPSSFGFEPWQLVVLQNMAIREKLLPVAWGAKKQLPTASHYVLVLARRASELTPHSPHIQSIMQDIQQLPTEAKAGKENMFRIFLESDFSLLENDRLVFEWASRQAYIAMGNMMTAAAQIGIDSCPIEGFQLENVERILEQEGVLDRSRFGLACMLAFGYRVREPRGKTRRPLEQIVSWVE